jgi:glycosyltransferase involved in cell wall biosynthesis
MLVVSHSAIIPGYRVLMNRISMQSEMEIHLVAPNSWIEANKEQSFISHEEIDKNLNIHVSRTITWGFKKRSFKNVTHIYPDIYNIINMIKPDILYIIEEPYSLVTATCIFASKMAGLDPAVIIFSGQSIYKRFPFPFNFLESYVLRNSDMAFPVNSDVAEVLMKKGFFKSRILPLGFDETIFCCSEKCSSVKKSDPKAQKQVDFEIGFVGALTEQKGIHILLSAFENILKRESSPSFILHIVGIGPLLSLVEKYVRQYPENIVYHGFVPHSDVAEIIKGTDLVVMPSIDQSNVKEQLGRVIVEAMACGVPVIGSTSGEISKVIGDSKMIFRADDVSALEKKILELMNDHELLEAKRRFSIERSEIFSWTNIGKTMLMHIRDLMWDLKGKRI